MCYTSSLSKMQSTTHSASTQLLRPSWKHHTPWWRGMRNLVWLNRGKCTWIPWFSWRPPKPHYSKWMHPSWWAVWGGKLSGRRYWWTISSSCITLRIVSSTWGTWGPTIHEWLISSSHPHELPHGWWHSLGTISPSYQTHTLIIWHITSTPLVSLGHDPSAWDAPPKSRYRSKYHWIIPTQTSIIDPWKLDSWPTRM